MLHVCQVGMAWAFEIRSILVHKAESRTASWFLFADLIIQLTCRLVECEPNILARPLPQVAGWLMLIVAVFQEKLEHFDPFFACLLMCFTLHSTDCIVSCYVLHRSTLDYTTGPFRLVHPSARWSKERGGFSFLPILGWLKLDMTSHLWLKK